MLAALALLSSLAQAPLWKEEFVGKPGYGHVTRILSMPDRLVFLDSPPPTVSDGGDIYLWRDSEPKPAKVFSVQEQGIRTLRQIGSQLIVPGIDAMENWDWGNWYLSSDKGQTWTKYRNLPHAMHVFDVAKWRGKLYMGISDPEGAIVSSTAGSEWHKDFGFAPKNSFGEVLSLVPLPDALYAFWVEQWGAGPKEESEKVDCFRFDGVKWEPRKLLPGGVHAVWNTKVVGTYALILLPGRSFLLQNDRAVPIPALDGLVPLDVADDGKSLIWLAAGSHYDYAVYRSTFAIGVVGKLEKISDLPAGLAGECVALHGGRVYVGGEAKPSGKIVSVDAGSPKAR